ncbi:hypothetical protein EVAR_49696_1 [Eumeta japonica]|uniref:Uncharacterized protein n=1 Tax=Eumeta variegata TaxID=151549 RepID=A0A4C1Z6W2_EUMVA|nr:hypothetical protein EVAR_49696_1 [Eumeta japonica]
MSGSVAAPPPLVSDEISPRAVTSRRRARRPRTRWPTEGRFPTTTAIDSATISDPNSISALRGTYRAVFNLTQRVDLNNMARRADGSGSFGRHRRRRACRRVRIAGSIPFPFSVSPIR